MFQKEIKNIEGLHRVVHVTNLPHKSEGFFVIKSLRNNICTGGIRITPSVTLEEVIDLANSMDMKFLAYDLEVGGAKSGLRIPADCSCVQRREILSEFAGAIKQDLESCYFTGTDLGSTNNDIEFMYKEIGLNQMILSKRLLKKTTMKSILFSIPDFLLSKIPVGYSKYGGLFTAKGILVAINSYYKLNNDDSSLKTIVIHGVGEVGSNFIKLLRKSNYRIKSFCDKNNGIIFKNEVRAEDVIKCINKIGIIEIKNIPDEINYEVVKPADILLIESDVLVLASVSNLINRDNFNTLKCRVIAEGANNAVMPTTWDELENLKIVVLPDFFINSTIACSFGLMVMNKISPYLEYNFLSKTIKYMEIKMLEIFKKSLKEKRSIRSVLIG